MLSFNVKHTYSDNVLIFIFSSNPQPQPQTRDGFDCSRNGRESCNIPGNRNFEEKKETRGSCK